MRAPAGARMYRAPPRPTRRGALDAGNPARDGDVRARGGHVGHERFDLGGGARSTHDRQQRSVGDRARGAGSAAFILIGSKVGDLFSRKRAYVLWTARLRNRCVGDGARSEPDRGHRVLGHHRRTRCIAAATRDAIPDPWQLRRRRATEGLRPRRGGRRDRRRGRTADRGTHHHVSVVAGRVSAPGRRDPDRPVRHRTRPRRAIHRTARRRSCRSGLSVLGMGGIVLGILAWQEGAPPSPC
jgi:hypothetical protein